MQATYGAGDGADDEIELIQPEDFLPHDPFPPDAQRMGIDRWSGGEIAFAASLNPEKQAHRIVAIVLLGAFLLPGVLVVLSLLR